MFRGAIILAVGFVLGYTKALHEDESVREELTSITASVKKLFEEVQRQSASEPDQAETSTDNPPRDSEPKEGEDDVEQ